MEMDTGGFFVGAVSGAMIGTAITAGQAARQAVHQVAQRQRDLGTIGRWQAALDHAQRRAAMSERAAAMLRRENAQLRGMLAVAELELAALRQA